MGGITKRLFVILLLFVISLNAWPVEISQGKIKLVLYKNIGRFSLYYVLESEDQKEKGAEKEEAKQISFFVDQDPRTSLLSLLVGKNVYRMGESGEFQETMKETSYGAQFLWISKELKVTQDFFVENEGLVIILTIENISEQDLDVGARYLFDTVLGESSGVHFVTNYRSKITKETLINSSNYIDYWISPLKESEDSTEVIGLKVITAGSGVTSPDRIIFANWKRLNDSSWSYKVSSSRDFSKLPYSVNDSAVCQYYDPRTVKKGKKRTIILYMVNMQSSYMDSANETATYSEYTESESESETESEAGSEVGSETESEAGSETENGTETADSNNGDTGTTTAETTAPEDDNSALQQDMATLNKLLNDINKLIESGEDISSEELSAMMRLVTELEKRIENY